MTLLGILLFLQPKTRVFDAVSIIALQFSRESYIVLPASTIILVKLAQLENAEFPILVTLFGISILVKVAQNLNTPTSILVTLLGNSMLVNFEQLENALLPILVTLFGI